MVKKKFGQIGQLKKDMVDYYKELHAAPWSQVLNTISDCNLCNYNIFIKDDIVFAYFEYTGANYEIDMDRMAECTVTRKWWNHSQPCFKKFAMSESEEFYADMERIFYFDGVKNTARKPL